MYKVRWKETALKDLKFIDQVAAKRIVNKITTFLVKDPINLGKPLTGIYTGFMRYRVGDYRIIYEVDKNEVRISIVKVGHRKEIYH